MDTLHAARWLPHAVIALAVFSAGQVVGFASWVNKIENTAQDAVKEAALANSKLDERDNRSDAVQREFKSDMLRAQSDTNAEIRRVAMSLEQRMARLEAFLFQKKAALPLYAFFVEFDDCDGDDCITAQLDLAPLAVPEIEDIHPGVPSYKLRDRVLEFKAAEFAGDRSNVDKRRKLEMEYERRRTQEVLLPSGSDKMEEEL